MIHKSKRTEGEFWEIHPKLRLILADADHWCSSKGIKEITVTCLIRSDLEQFALFTKRQTTEQTSVHQFGRGADLRILFPDELNQQLMDYLNGKYPYDVSRPALKTVIRHGGTADHLHIQVRT